MIYGPPCTGKTTGARTFPNPIIVDFDNNIPPGTPDVIPMWSDAFVDTVVPRRGNKYPDRIQALVRILGDLAAGARANQTIILDSLTRLETWYNLHEEEAPKPITEKGKVDKFELFRWRFAYFTKLLTLFSACPANIVFICHQQQEKDDDGRPVGQLKPHLVGQSADKLPGMFPTLLQAVRRTDKDGNVEFVWRVRPGNWEPARTPKPAKQDFIPQDYKTLLNYL